ncbi:MAG: hypothetical protein OQJ81_09160 [Melioribacteraceae bacterium]|nr:hypothetical protein [Melioribacteraceae bacterium]
MSNKKNSVLQVLIALLFAGAILLTSYLMNGSEYSKTATFLLIGLWFIPFSYLVKIKNKNRKTTCC